jgi:endonuclease I
MFKRPIGLLLFFVFGLSAVSAQTPIGGNLADAELRTFLKDNYYIVTSLGYNTARDRMYGNIDPVDGRIVCVYSGYSKTGTTRTAMNGTSGTGVVQINTEHTWPQSLFGSSNPMQGDIHHLYPTWERPNGSRSNNPFGEIDDNVSSTWFGGSYLQSISTTTKPNESVILNYSQSAGGKFEPRADHKGNVARTMFYFWTMYSTHSAMGGGNSSTNANFFNGMKDVLYKWHREDPVDAKELARTHAIATYQGKPNPFVLDSTLVRRAYFFVPTSIESPEPIAREFTVSPAYPNPFNPQTSVQLTLDRSSAVTAVLVDAMGREVLTVANGTYPQGAHTLRVNGAGLASGIYFLRILSASHMDVVPMMLMK